MLIILFLILFVFVSNFFEVTIPHDHDGILKKSNNEYITLFEEYGATYTYTNKVEYDNVTVVEKKYFSRLNYNENSLD